ncbi:MAG: hypothetical protein WCV56_03970 [Candidatus Omnitrophota bacterium]
MLTVFILSVIFFSMFLAAHMLIFHFFNPSRKFRSILITALVFGAGYAGFLAVLPEEALFYGEGSLGGVIFERGAEIYLYFFLWYFYFHSLVVVDRSISVRMLVEIFKSRGSGLSLEEIKGKYSLEEKFSDELRDMLFLDRFREQGELYSNTRKASAQARIFRFLKGYMNLSRDAENNGRDRAGK